MIDYKTFARAVQSNDQQRLSHFSAELLPKITSYVKAVTGASHQIAEEAAHNAFIELCRRVEDEKTQISQDLLNYLLVSARNNYLRMMKTESRYESIDEDEVNESLVNPADQVESMIEDEYKQIIRNCIKQLNRRPRLFLLFVMKYPNYSPKEVSHALDMTEGSVRSTKTKLMRWLQECFEHNREKREQKIG